MSNQASQPRRVTVTAVAAVAAGERRQAVHEVVAKLTSSRMSNPTQVALQWLATYRSGSLAASPNVHGIMARDAARANAPGQRPRRGLGGDPDAGAEARRWVRAEAARRGPTRVRSKWTVWTFGANLVLVIAT